MCVCVWKLSIFDAISSVRNLVAVAFVFWVGKLRQLGQSRNTQGKQKAVQMTVIPPPPTNKRKTKQKKTHPECVGFGVTRRQGLFVCVCCWYLDFKSSARLYSNEHDVISQQQQQKEARQHNLGQKMFIIKKMKLSSSSSSLMYFKTGAILWS